MAEDHHDATGDPGSTGEIGRRAVRGSALSLGAAATTWVLGGVRMVLLTHWLLPADVGLFAQAMVFVGLALQIQTFGLTQAFLHRRTSDETVLGTFFTLRIGLQIGAMALVLLAIPVITPFYPEMPALGSVILFLALVEAGRSVNAAQMTVLSRRMAFREIAVSDILCSASMTLVAPVLAWQGFGVWSLVGEQAAAMVTRMVVLHGAFRMALPRPRWRGEIARWFFAYGRSVWFGTSLAFVIERFGDFWIGRALGARALGLYSRSVDFAAYPRRVISVPLLKVFLPTYARLQDDRLALSKAFFRATSLMVRIGFGLAAVSLVAADDLIRLIGPQWLEMVPVFRVLLVVTLLLPVSDSARDLLFAAGHPHLVVATRVAQVAVFVPAMILLTARWGLLGAAVAMDLAAVIATVILFRASRRVVDYSLTRLWLWPTVAAALAVVPWPWLAGTIVAPLPRLLALGATSAAIYAAVLWVAERRRILEAVGVIRDRLRS